MKSNIYTFSKYICALGTADKINVKKIAFGNKEHTTD